MLNSLTSQSCLCIYRHSSRLLWFHCFTSFKPAILSSQALKAALLADAPPLLQKQAPAAFRTLIEDLQVGRGDAFLELLARQAVVNFLHNDLHWAVKKFLANAKVSSVVKAPYLGS